MKRLGLVLAIFLIPSILTPAPRAFGKFGTLTVSNLSVTLPFNPSYLCVNNDDAAILIYVNFATGTAAIVSDASNIQVNGTEKKCWTFQDKNVNNVFIVGLIAASGTPAYHLDAVR